MRLILISALVLGLVSACSNVRLGPHRIDVQQGNALDQENVSRLKTGLNRSQVRFLLGTPLVVDPFRNDRWDYVYVNYKAGKLAEQKRISLFFDGDTLVRIAGDVPPPEAALQPSEPTPAVEPKAESRVEPAAPPVAEATPLARPVAPKAEPISVTSAADSSKAAAPDAKPVSTPSTPAPEPRTASVVASSPVATPASPPAAASTAAVATPAPVKSAPVVTPPASTAAAATARSAHADEPAVIATSVVTPLPSPKDAPAYRDPRAPGQLALATETDVEQIRPDVMPPFPEPGQAAATPARQATQDDAVLAAVRNWARAWSSRDEAAYVAAYDIDYVPPGGGSRTEWENRRRMLLGVARQIEVKIESPVVRFLPDGTALVTFNQHYRSDSHRDVVAKQLRLAERQGRWLITEEKVLAPIRGVAQ